MRRYRYQHLRNTSSVPMSVRNNDRHGLGELKHDGTKPIDRLKVPLWLIYVWVFSGFMLFAFRSYSKEEEDLEKLQRRNTLLAMKKQQHRIEYGDNDVTPAE